MIYRTEIYICDVCGRVESFAEDSHQYAEPIIEYPEDWVIVENVEEKTCLVHCKRCFEENLDKFEGTMCFGTIQYKYKKG